MALGLNSTLEFREGNKKLPPCPVVYLAHTEGVLQVYYFVHKTLPTICRKAELIKPNPVSSSSTSKIDSLLECRKKEISKAICSIST